MGTWKLVDNAVVDLARGQGAVWFDPTNTSAVEFNTILVYGADFDNTNITVNDFIASGVGESNNYTRKAIGATTFTPGAIGKPYWVPDTDLHNITPTDTCDANYIAIYSMSSGSDDTDRNIIAVGDLGSISVSGGSNLVIDFAATGIFQADDPNS